MADGSFEFARVRGQLVRVRAGASPHEIEAAFDAREARIAEAAAFAAGLPVSFDPGDPRPLLLIDVDGVVCPYGDELVDPLEAGLEQATVGYSPVWLPHASVTVCAARRVVPARLVHGLAGPRGRVSRPAPRNAGAAGHLLRRAGRGGRPLEVAGDRGLRRRPPVRVDRRRARSGRSRSCRTAGGPDPAGSRSTGRRGSGSHVEQLGGFRRHGARVWPPARDSPLDRRDAAVHPARRTAEQTS